MAERMYSYTPGLKKIGKYRITLYPPPIHSLSLFSGWLGAQTTAARPTDL